MENFNNSIGIKNSQYKIALYIHIPFCKSKCIYCDFYSLPSSKSNPILKSFIDKIIEWYDFFIGNLSDIDIETIYIGGGTPSLLSPKLLEKLFNSIIDIYQRNNKPFSPMEWTVEVNPESLTDSFIRVCRDYGVTRLSVGIQTLKSEYLELLKRPGNIRDIFNAFSILEKLWDREINFDLLSGIPGTQNLNYQSTENLIRDLEILTSLNPSHISLYSLTVEPDTPLHRLLKEKKLNLPSKNYLDKLWLSGKRFLQERGYNNYEISNFAKPGKESLHNLFYWRLNPYLGIGPSAVSTMPLQNKGKKEASVYRFSFPNSLNHFLNSSPDLKNLEIEWINNREFLFENLMMGFRLKEGIEKKLFKQRFKHDLFEIIPNMAKIPKLYECFKNTKTHYRLKERCRFILNRFLVTLDKQMETLQNSQIQVVWPQDKRQGR